MSRTLVPSMYWKKNPSCAAAIVAANTAGSRGRRPGGGSSSSHAARNGPERISSAPINSNRCVGESRASMDTSIPKRMCQNMSPIAPAMKTTTPATEDP